MIKGKRIFITGGAGFIGTALVGRLLDHNEVVVFDNLTRNALSDRPYREHPSLTVIEGDVLDTEHLADAMQGAAIVFHCAAIAGIRTVIQNPIATIQVNLVGTANVLAAAAQLPGVDRVVCFSTSEVFGPKAFNSEESDDAIIGKAGEARWTYCVSKLVGEHLAAAYWQEKKLPTTVIRPFNVYGPGQVGQGALRTFIRQALKNQTIEIHGDGSQIRAWCYVDDVVDGVLIAAKHPKGVGESFNIGNRKAVVTIHGLANTVIRVLGSKSNIVFTRKDYADVELRVPSVRKAKDLLNFEAKVSLEEGILLAAEYYREVP